MKKVTTTVTVTLELEHTLIDAEHITHAEVQKLVQSLIDDMKEIVEGIGIEETIQVGTQVETRTAATNDDEYKRPWSFDYDENFYGGIFEYGYMPYETVNVPAQLVRKFGPRNAFEYHTGYDMCHIIGHDIQE